MFTTPEAVCSRSFSGFHWHFIGDASPRIVHEESEMPLAATKIGLAFRFAVTTKQDRADEAPLRWAEQYARGASDRQKEITRLLAALPKPIDGAEVDRIVGNGSWTRLECNGCNQDAPAVAHYGYGDYSLSLCAECLKEGLRGLTGK
jgi:hypothetical protein